MSALVSCLSAAGWAAWCFLWQGTLVAGVVWALLARLRAPRARHALALAGVGAGGARPRPTRARGAPAMSPLTWLLAAAPPALPASVAEPTVVVVASPVVLAPLQPLIAAVNGAVAWIGAAWLLATAWRLGACARELVALCRLHAAAVALGQTWRPNLVARLARRTGLRAPARAIATGLVRVPVVCGTLRPLILLPRDLAGLEARHACAIVAHELEHVRGRDTLWNLIQCLVEAACRMHPALGWLSDRAREERELRCDAAAARAVGPLACAEALALLARRAERPPARATSMASGALEPRVRRLLGMPDPPCAGSAWRRSLRGAIAAATLLSALGVAQRDARHPIVPRELELQALAADGASPRAATAPSLVFVPPGVTVAAPGLSHATRGGCLFVAAPGRAALAAGRPVHSGMRIGAGTEVSLPCSGARDLGLRLDVADSRARLDLRHLPSAGTR